MAYQINQNGMVYQVKGLTLEKMQHIVDGYIQLLTSEDGNTLFVCDEEGKLKNKPINVTATRFAHASKAIRRDDFLSAM